MSDFEDILNAPTQEILEARLFKWTSRVMKKWRTTGINELEGYQLLLIWSQRKVTTALARQRKRELRFEENGRVNGLQYAAIVFEKDERTIRRWCEKKYFPGANQTDGGHWRIPIPVVEMVYKLHPKGFGRSARSLFGTKDWKLFKKDAVLLFVRRFGEAMALEAALQDKSESEFATAPVPFSRTAVDKLKTVIDTGQTDYANLRYLARRLFKEDPNRPINYKLLAAALRINPSTLYRRYGKAGVRSAIKAAAKPIRQREAELKEAPVRRELTEEELDAAELQETFSEIEVEKNIPSPFIPQANPDESDQ